MSLIFVHLRWNDVRPEQFDQVCRALPPGSPLPEGCCSHQLRYVGRVLFGVGAWTDPRAAERFVDGLPDALSAAGLAAPQVAAFSVPTGYGVGYTGPRVHEAGVQSGPRAPLVPVRAPVVEEVPVGREMPLFVPVAGSSAVAEPVPAPAHV